MSGIFLIVEEVKKLLASKVVERAEIVGGSREK